MAEVSVDTTPVEEKLEAVTIEEAAPEEEAAAGEEAAAAPVEEAAAVEEPAIQPVAEEPTELEPPPAGIEINFEQKHPLQRIWTMWYDNPGESHHDRSPRSCLFVEKITSRC